MSLNKLQAIVLAAGKATRFKTGNTKLIEKICGQEMIVFSAKLLEKLNIPTIFVVGYQKEIIENLVSKHTCCKPQFIHQEKQLGTGHAVACTKDLWNQKNILILNGDVPLVTQKIIEKLYKKHTESDAAISFVVSHYTGSDHAYGRVVEDEKSIRIVEAKDFNQDIYDEQCCINAGIYLIKTTFLKSCINKLTTKNASQEFYLTDLVQMACKKNLKVVTSYAPFDRIRGINDFEELWAAEQIKRSEIIKHWMKHGVRFHLAQKIHIDIGVQIGVGSTIGSGVHLLGNTAIGQNCNIRKFSTLENATIEDNVEIFPNTIIRDSYVSKHAKIGPFAHIHSESTIEQHAVVGNFVEVKKSTVGSHTKAKHLTYLGNATIGSKVNIGAGTITCNHDGVKKHQTIIQDNAYVGSNNTLVAPITIGKNSFTAAGSTITKDTPSNSLAIGRTRQINKENYAQKLLEKLKARSAFINKKNETAHVITPKKIQEKEL